jgi:hypothetical protein
MTVTSGFDNCRLTAFGLAQTSGCAFSLLNVGRPEGLRQPRTRRNAQSLMTLSLVVRKSETQKGATRMTKRIAILVMAMGMSVGLANRVTTISLAQSQDEKMQSDDKMKDDKMAGDKMAGDKKEKAKKKSSKKDAMSHDDKMSDQGKAEQPKQ